jgi:nitrous oxide reductase
MRNMTRVQSFERRTLMYAQRSAKGAGLDRGLLRVAMLLGIAIVTLSSGLLLGCAEVGENGAEDVSAAEVRPGELDDYYGFWSGGH